MISQRAVDAIISFEVSSRKYYEKHYEHPEWPGGRSGITIGIGYDIAYASVPELLNDWQGKVTPSQLNVMQTCIGVKGDDARDLLPRVRDSILIPWDTAMNVFLCHDIPKWTSAVCRAIPGADRLPADCLGALVSLAYNRGASFDEQGDRYAEMRAIKAHVMRHELPVVASDIRAMKRLWPDVAGLRSRRDAEAALWERGLDPKNTDKPLPDAPHSPTERPKSPIPPKSGAPQHGALIGTLIATAVAVRQWGIHHAGSIVIAAIGIASGIAFFFVVRNAWDTPVLANQKDRP